jgi:hypothetical protein
MARFLFTFSCLIALAAWAGAQGTAPRSAAEQLNMLRTDRVLLGNLVDDSLGLSGANTPLEKAEACRRTTRTISDALGQAVGDQDANRVAELGGHLETVVRDALVPSFDDAKRLIPDDSPEAAKLKELKQKAVGDFDAVRGAIPTSGKVGNNERVKDTRSKLDKLRERLK